MNETMNEEIALIQIKGLLTILGYVDQAEEQLKILALGITELDLLRKLQKEHAKTKKALETIKEKEVNVQNFKVACATMSYEQYEFMWNEGCFMGIKMMSKTMLDQEEYDLLKEVLL